MKMVLMVVLLALMSCNQRVRVSQEPRPCMNLPWTHHRVEVSSNWYSVLDVSDTQEGVWYRASELLAEHGIKHSVNGSLSISVQVVAHDMERALLILGEDPVVRVALDPLHVRCVQARFYESPRVGVAHISKSVGTGIFGLVPRLDDILRRSQICYNLALDGQGWVVEVSPSDRQRAYRLLELDPSMRPLLTLGN